MERVYEGVPGDGELTPPRSRRAGWTERLGRGGSTRRELEAWPRCGDGGAARSTVERRDGGGLAHARDAPRHGELSGEVVEARGRPGDGDECGGHGGRHGWGRD